MFIMRAQKIFMALIPPAADLSRPPSAGMPRRSCPALGPALCAMLLLSPAAVTAQAAKVPDIPIKLLQADRTSLKSWSELKGKAVVLEFWATWCAPCIEKFPELTRLAGKFSDKPVQFIFVTDESRDTVTAFLKRRSIPAGWVAYDAKEAFAAFGVTERPATILIDRSGRRSGEVFATELDERVLGDLLAGRAVGREKPSLGGPKEALASAWLARSFVTVTQMRLGNDLQGRGVDLETLLRYVYDVPSVRMELSPAGDRETRYDFEVKGDGKHPESVSPLWRSLVEASLPVRMKLVAQERTVWVLRKTTETPAGLLPTGEKLTGSFSFSVEKGEFLAESGNFARFVSNLENALGEPLVDDTGLAGKWRMKMSWEPGDVPSLRRALEEQMGLALEREQRSVEILQVDPL